MTFKKYFPILFFMLNLFCQYASGQALAEQIIQAYRIVDTCSYIESLRQSYRASLIIYAHGAGKKEDLSVIIDRLETMPRQSKVIDRLWIELSSFSKDLIEKKLKQFEAVAYVQKPVFVLNLTLQPDKTLQVDTGRLPFNLIYFDKNCKGKLFVFCEDGEYSWSDSYYLTFSRKLGQNAPKVFCEIMKKEPDYWLYCYQLEEMNTILYMKNEHIYVYRIIEMEEYELSEYLEKFKGKLSVKSCL